MQKKALVYDIGGTKIECAVITSDGHLLSSKKIRTPNESWALGKKAIVELGREFISQFPDIEHCGFSAAGPLHAESGMLMHPTNLSWGHVHLTQEISEALKLEVALENDAACAVIAEHWRGEESDRGDLITVTLGTGLGVGVLINHNLLRGGHKGMHPEIGHLVLEAGDKSATCGCGNLGCAEAFLSGSHFVKRARTALQDPSLTATILIDKAKAGDGRVIRLFENYSFRMAQFMTNLVVSFYPGAIVLAGSFSKASSLFLPQTKKHLLKFLEKRIEATPELWPNIRISTLQNPGLWGAARIAFQRIDSCSIQTVKENL